MASISELLAQIMSARYGKDVRQSIHDAIEKIDEIAEGAEASATASAESASQSATASSASATSASASAESASASAEEAQAIVDSLGDIVTSVNGAHGDVTLTIPHGDGTTITMDSDGTLHGANTYELPTASTTTLGGVKVDGTTTKMTNGVLSSAGLLSVTQAEYDALTDEEKASGSYYITDATPSPSIPSSGVKVNNESTIFNSNNVQGVVEEISGFPIMSGVKVKYGDVNSDYGGSGCAQFYKVSPKVAYVRYAFGGANFKANETMVTLPSGFSASSKQSLYGLFTRDIGGIVATHPIFVDGNRMYQGFNSDQSVSSWSGIITGFINID